MSRLTTGLQFFTGKGHSLLVSLVLLSFMTACNPNGALITPNNQTASVENLQVTSSDQTLVADTSGTLQSAASFPIGVALNSKLLTGNPKVKAIVAREFDSRTVPMYMNVEWVQGQFNFGEMDYAVKQAETTPVRLHGHCLVYHVAAPEWLTAFKGTTPEFEKAVKNHIQTLVGRYKGKVKSWDVINEIIDYRTGKISNNAFRKLYNNDEDYIAFVKNCFQWAHEADPNALLFWNEDVYEISPLKQATVLSLVDNFKRSNTPIDGLGTQLHINVNTSNDGIRTSLQKLASTGLLIHVSELDVALNPNKNKDLVITDQLLTAQRAKYQTVVNTYKQNVPARLQYGITLWGLDDANSWLVTATNQREMPCLFDSQFNKKLAYFSFLNALK